jgi:integrase
MEQSKVLLQSVSGQNEVRDYAILMLFLNCGIRRSELVGLNIQDVYEDRIRVVRKGNKERFVYFGTPCRKAIDNSMAERNERVLTDNRALFGSRNGNRICVTAVHRLVEKALKQAGEEGCMEAAGGKVLSPKVSMHFRGEGSFRYYIIVKCPKGQRSRYVYYLDNFSRILLKDKADCVVNIDVNPYSFI